MWREALEVAKRDGLKKGRYFHDDGRVCLVGAAARGCGVDENSPIAFYLVEEDVKASLKGWLGRDVTPVQWFDKEASEEDALLFLKHMAHEEGLAE